MSDSKMIWKDEPHNRLTHKDFEIFLMWCFHVGASDIFIATSERLAIMYNDKIIEVGKRYINTHEIEAILNEIDQPASFSIIKSGVPRDFQFTVQPDEDPDSAARFRISATGEKSGVEVVIRTIPAIPPSCEDLNVEREIVKASKAEFGLVLITGPTGSGKSTLNAALLGDIAINEAKHIITYESPIEFDLKAIKNRKARIAQTAIPDHLANFPTAVSNALRRKPHIILIGEARDKETIAGCITASQTGHLVYSTVHTNSVGMTISRMVDEFPPDERKATSAKLVDAMRLIVHQRLIHKKGGGRCAIKEYLVFTDDIRRFLLEKLADSKVVDIGTYVTALVKKYGQPLLDDLDIKFEAGLIEESTYKELFAELGSGDEIIDIVIGEN
ncbi:MAG: ATPase, T2SS/T4P/T4SS family [Methylococcales bacterium]